MTNADLHYKKMTETPVSRLIISMGIPTTVSLLITSIYNMADTYFVGMIGESAQAATGVMFTLQTIIQGIGYLMGHGSGSYVSKHLADKNLREASSYISSSFFVSAGIGIVMGLFGLLFLEPLVMLMGSTKTIAPHAMDYGFWILVSCPFVLCSLVLNIALRYEGKALLAMFGLTAGGFLNIFGDYLLVYKLHMGVYGAGLATALSQMVSFCILLVIYEKLALSSIRLRFISSRLYTYTNIVRVGFPSLIRQGLTAVTTGILNNMTRPFGDAAIAAMSVVSKYSTFLMCIGLGAGQGFQPIASFNYQAKKYKRVKKALVFLISLALVCFGGVALVSILFAEPIIRLFQPNPEVIEIGSRALRFCTIGLVFSSFSVPVSMLYQGIQQPRISTIMALFRAGLITVPALLLLVPPFGVLGIQLAQPLAEVVAGLVSLPYIIGFLKNHPDE